MRCFIYGKGWRRGWGPDGKKASKFGRGLCTVKGRALVISTHKPAPEQLGVDLINGFSSSPELPYDDLLIGFICSQDHGLS